MLTTPSGRREAEITANRWGFWVIPCLLYLSAGLCTVPLIAQEKAVTAESLAPGWSELAFDPPKPGEYELPPMGEAGEGRLLDSTGTAVTLHELMGDKVVVLSFIYSSCSDINGCPLATHVLERLQNQLLQEPDSGDGVRLISLSFDPGQDTPEVMQRYGSSYIRGNFDWRFLTTQSAQQLDPILQSYGQAIIRDPGTETGEPGNISHMLRVFLIDRKKRIRNVYSASYLHIDSMLNDIRTLQLESPAELPDAEWSPSSRTLQGPGDYKQGYEGTDYQTSALSLSRREGAPADLLRHLESPPLGLPPIPVPGESPLTVERVGLGRLLFFDRRLSQNKTISCAMCHVPEQGFSSNEMATAVGIEGRTVRRNAPTIYNVAYVGRLFHDGRETSLEQQIWGPLLAINEMGNPSVGQVIEQIASVPEYPEMFEQAFDDGRISMENVGAALASYERVLVSANSRFDRWYFGSQPQALSRDEQAGFELFTGKAGCSACHLIAQDWALFSDGLMHNTGVGYRRSMLAPAREARLTIAPGQTITVSGTAVAEASEPLPNDLGLYEITGNPDDRWKYRTPTLRNIALTAPYMHDGSLSTLQQVITFYDGGGIANALLDPLIRPLDLSANEMDELLAFLISLTGDNVDAVVEDAFTVPIGNTGSK